MTVSALMTRPILVVDDDAAALETIARVVRGLPADYRTTATLDSALTIARTERPAAVIAALEIGGSQVGLTLGRVARQRYGSAVILTAQRFSPRHVDAVAAFTPDGFLCHPFTAEQMDATLRLALAARASASPGERAGETGSVAPSAETELARALRSIAAIVHGTGVTDPAPPTGGAPPDQAFAMLRPREQDVVRLMFEHYRVPAIATRLGISPQTVRNHLKHIFQRLGVHSQQELIVRLRGSARSHTTEDPSTRAD